MTLKPLQHVSLRTLAMAALSLISLCVLAFALLTWSVIKQSQNDLTLLERVNVQQASSLNRLHIAGLEGLHRLDRALERQLRPSLGDPVEALEAVEHELDEMTHALATFLAATRDYPGRDAIEARATALIDTMTRQLEAVRTGDRGGYRQLTVEALLLSQAFTLEARAFYQLANRQGTYLLSQAQQRAGTLGQWLVAGVGAAIGLLLLIAYVGQRFFLRPVKKLALHFQTLAQGDLSTAIERPGRNEIGRLYAELETMRHAFIDTITNLHDQSRAMFESAQRLALGNEDLAIRTRQQHAFHETTTANLEELTTHTASTARYATDAEDLTTTASTQTTQANRVMDNFLATMERIHERANEVDGIVGTIDAIAFQTNILALNASVEAARAGVQGKGFTVVAQEVRGLATRSAEAAQQIKTLLADSTRQIQHGHALSGQASATLCDIAETTDKANRLMAHIAEAAKEQHRHIERLNTTLVEQTQVNRANKEQVESSAQDALALERIAEQLREAASRFRIEPATQRPYTWQHDPTLGPSMPGNIHTPQALLE
ncbi:methyl-accepting chemotaxis protein [Vreelandella sp. EE22]